MPNDILTILSILLSLISIIVLFVVLKNTSKNKGNDALEQKLDYMNKNIKYSQNFLTSEKVLNQIIKQLNLKETDTVYEIGTGKGHLTDYIIRETFKNSKVYVTQIPRSNKITQRFFCRNF